MRESFLDDRVHLHPGDCLDVLATLEPDSVDSSVTDPPYGLSFMGKHWDHGVPGVAFWKAVYRVLKPGAHLVAFAGTRTYHRMACAIEDAGFEIRDQLAWAYGSGFPKSLDVSKAIDKAAGAEREVISTEKVRDIRNGHGRGNGDGINAAERDGPIYMQRDITAPATDAARQWQGYGTALKPAWEPIVLARKPLIGTVAENVLKHGTGAINIDGCRVASGEERPVHEPTKRNGNVFGDGLEGSRRTGETQTQGRWPANLVHDGSDEVVGAFPTVGDSHPPSNAGSIRKNQIYGADNEPRTFHAGFPDSGSAARFFYTSKADADDRLGSKHPTVKPVDLMQWLVRLVTPKNGICLDPFAGTGTTGEAAFREGMRAILIEREAEYQDDIRRRMKLCLAGPQERARESIKAKLKDKPDDLTGTLFDSPVASA